MTPSSPKLTTPERLALPRLGSNSETAITCHSFSAILDISLTSTRGILASLVQKGFAARTPQRRNTKYWRIRNADSGTVTICAGTTLDDSIANLQARAARADALEEALVAVLNILAEHGIHVPVLDSSSEEPLALSQQPGDHP